MRWGVAFHAWNASWVIGPLNIQSQGRGRGVGCVHRTPEAPSGAGAHACFFVIFEASCVSQFETNSALFLVRPWWKKRRDWKRVTESSAGVWRPWWPKSRNSSSWPIREPMPKDKWPFSVNYSNQHRARLTEQTTAKPMVVRRSTNKILYLQTFKDFIPLNNPPPPPMCTYLTK